ncbi:hypothetical protein BH10CYA1_BH10CYA1_33900 [soil metagenome]
MESAKKELEGIKTCLIVFRSLRWSTLTQLHFAKKWNGCNVCKMLQNSRLSRLVRTSKINCNMIAKPRNKTSLKCVSGVSQNRSTAKCWWQHFSI